MKNKIENKRTPLDEIQTDNHSITFVILDQKKFVYLKKKIKSNWSIFKFFFLKKDLSNKRVLNNNKSLRKS